MTRALLRKPDPDHIEIAHQGESVRIAILRRPTARRLTLRVSSATGAVILTLPTRSSLAAAQKFAQSHGGWIAARLAKLPERVPFVAGSVIPLRGQPHRIVQGEGRGTAEADPASATLAVPGDAAYTTRRVREFLMREARRDLSQSVAFYAARLGQRPARVTLRDTRSRWGSCTARGELNFSWRLILAPPVVLDYLVAHEMAHLREMNHSPRFWALANDLCPHVEEAERWLKRHGSELHRYG